MPSVRHEFAVELVGRHPQLVRMLLGPRLEDSLDHPVADADFHRSDATVGQLPALGCDVCVELYWPGTTTPCLVTIVEVQLAIDKRKPPSWFAYQASQHYRTNAPALLVVVTNSREVAQWAAGPFWSGQTWLRPIVIGPGDLPAITDPEEARRALPLAFLSGIVHGREKTAVPIGLALAHAVDGSLDDGLGLYWDAFLASLDEPIRKELEMLLQRNNWEPRSDWGKDFFNKGKAAGHDEGRTEGRTEGLTEGRATSLLMLLEHRGLTLSTALRDRIATCTDLAVLDHWFRRAASGDSLERIFTP
jgi:hypothetical protein